MPVARIVTPLINPKSQALRKLSERLEAAGFDVEIVAPDTPGDAPDLVVDVGEWPTGEAVEKAFDLARRDDADLFLAPGLFIAHRNESAAVNEPMPAAGADDEVVASGIVELCASEPLPVENEREFVDASVLAGSEETQPAVAADLSEDEERESGPPEVAAQPVQQVGGVVQEGSSGFRDALAGVYGRVAGTLSELQQRRAETMQAMREERERRDAEREQQRRERELQLQRDAEEKKRVEAERAREAAERERELRDQQAREAAVRAEQERVEREAIAREAARRAQDAQAAEQERRRQAALEAERVRVTREQEAQRAAAMAAEQARQEQEGQRAAASAIQFTTASKASQPSVGTPSRTSPVPVTHAYEPLPKPRLVPRPRRRRGARERQWQRAAFVASIATLAAMIGFAIAANRNPVSPLPQALKQNEVKQQVPFGAARIDVSSTKAPPVPARPVPTTLTPTSNGELGGTPVSSLSARRSASNKPSAAKAVAKRPARRPRTGGSSANDDEVIVRHSRPQSTESARQTNSDGVRHYSDQ